MSSIRSRLTIMLVIGMRSFWLGRVCSYHIAEWAPRPMTQVACSPQMDKPDDPEALDRGSSRKTAPSCPATFLKTSWARNPLGQDDAWEAARTAGLDSDLKNMPMGMQTMLSEGAATLSGGQQRQHLLIARSLVRWPCLLLFNEATSTLDNRTQGIISHSLKRLLKSVCIC